MASRLSAEAGVVRFTRTTILRVLREGYEAWALRGPVAECPYGSDERNGVWSFGRRQAKDGLNFSRAIKNFDRMEHP